MMLLALSSGMQLIQNENPKQKFCDYKYSKGIDPKIKICFRKWIGERS